MNSITPESLQNAVLVSKSLAEVLRQLGIYHGSNSYKMLRNLLHHYNIDYLHFKEPKIPLNKILVENSSYNRVDLKRRLIAEFILVEKCSLCGIGPEWNGKPLVLQLDHVNGVSKDNRLSNIRLLCPNCHSQTSTFGGKNTRRVRAQRFCQKCSLPCSDCANLCRKCAVIDIGSRRRKACRPPKEELLMLIAQHGYCWVGRKYGVTDNAIRKWVKSAS